MDKILEDLLPKYLSKPDADLGIGAPHYGYEAILMKAGKKPCLITSWPLARDGNEDFTQLKPLIESGHIVVIGVRGFTYPHHILCMPETLESAKRAAFIKQKELSGHHLTREEWQSYESFLAQYCNIQVRDEEGRFTGTELNRRAHNTEGEYKLLLDGNILATLPLMTGEDFKNTPRPIQDYLTSGNLCAAFAGSTTNGSAILAQKNCIEIGRELYARYWNNDKGYPPLSGAECTRRIGHLLGYTPEDTEFFLTVGTRPISLHTREQTARIAAFELLRYARAQSLLKESSGPYKSCNLNRL